MGEGGRPPPLRHAGGWLVGPQQWERRRGQPCRSPTSQKSKASVPVSPPSPPFHAHAHTGDTLTTLSTPQRGSHLESLRSPLGAREGPSPQARPGLRQVLPSSSQASLLQGGERDSHRPRGQEGRAVDQQAAPELTELVSTGSRRAGAAVLLYPHGGPYTGCQWSPGPVFTVRVCGRGHEGAQ